MGREYSHWIDLTLNSHFEAVMSEIYRTEVRFLSKSTFLGVTKRSKNGTERSSGPNTDLLGQKKRGGGRADLKNAGVKTFSSFILTLVVKKETGKRKRDMWPYRALIQ